MESGEKTNQELAKEFVELTNKTDALSHLQEMLKKNYIEWAEEKITYRVRKPTYTEQTEVREVKIRKHNQLRIDPDYKYQEQLIREYKEKGIDIVKLTEETLNLTYRIKELQLKLAEFGNLEKKDNQVISDLEIQIYNLMVERESLVLEKINLLSDSIESQILVLINSYVCYLVLEKKEGENWIRVFKNYDEFMNSDNEKLKNTAGNYLNYILQKMGSEDEPNN